MSAMKPDSPAGEPDAERIVPVAREEAQVSKREVETGRVRIEKRVVEREQAVEEMLRSERVDVERVACDVEVDGPLEPRQENDCLVIPVVEEFLVVQKRWRLTAEVRIRRRVVERPHEERIPLRAEDVRVTRTTGTSEEPLNPPDSRRS